MDFVNELRFQMTRLIAVSYIAGINAGALTYFGLHRYIKLYLLLPLTVIAFSQTRNLVTRNGIDRIYIPLEPVFTDIKNNTNITTKNTFQKKREET